jgi:hypothetical protein
MRRLVTRSAVVLVGTLVVLLVAAAPASAHTISGPRPSNYRSMVTKIQPPAPGITVRIVDLGAKTQLTNRTSSDATVLGYENEPYLRIGPDGVFENLHSAATYINRTRQGGVVPEGVDTSPTLPPEWHKLSDGNSWAWHDHRAHYMGLHLPPIVQNAPGRFHHISVGEIEFVHNGVTSTAFVALDWVPGPSSVPWIPAFVVVFAAALVVAVLPRSWKALALSIAFLVVVDMAHAITYEIGRYGSNMTKALGFLGGSFVSIFVWIGAVFTIIGLWRRRTEALYGAVFVGVMFALVGGATDLSSLWKSQLPSAGPDALTRLSVVLLLAGGAGIALGALIRGIRSDRGAPVRAEAEPGGWIRTLVVGLDERELRRIAADLDVDDVLAAALHEVALRMRDTGDALANGALVLDIASDDEQGLHTWSISGSPSTLDAGRGPVEPAAGRIAVAFPVLLQLLAGTVALDDAIASGRVKYTGDPAVAAEIGPRLPENALVTSPNAPSDDHASAP